MGRKEVVREGRKREREVRKENERDGGWTKWEGKEEVEKRS